MSLLERCGLSLTGRSPSPCAPGDGREAARNLETRVTSHSSDLPSSRWSAVACCASERECGREDSNLHPRRDRDLNPARLPVSPRPRQPIMSVRSPDEAGLSHARGKNRAVPRALRLIGYWQNPVSYHRRRPPVGPGAGSPPSARSRSSTCAGCLRPPLLGGVHMPVCGEGGHGADRRRVALARRTRPLPRSARGSPPRGVRPPRTHTLRAGTRGGDRPLVVARPTALTGRPQEAAKVEISFTTAGSSSVSTP